jgi:hypothetical protein
MLEYRILPEGLRFISFRPLNEKKNSLRTLRLERSPA